MGLKSLKKKKLTKNKLCMKQFADKVKTKNPIKMKLPSRMELVKTNK